MSPSPFAHLFTSTEYIQPDEKYDNRFVHPCTMQVAGPYMSGKTHWLVGFLLMLKNAVGVVSNAKGENITFDRMTYCCGSGWQEEFQPLKDAGIQIVTGPLTQELLNDILSSHGNKLIVTDDNLTEDNDSNHLTELYTKHAHHCNCTTIKVTQNPFDKGGGGKAKHITQNRNTHYWILFRFKGDTSGVFTLINRTEQKVVAREAYEAISKIRFGYLLLDCHPLSQGAPVRTNIGSEEGPIIVFKLQNGN